MAKTVVADWYKNKRGHVKVSVSLQLSAAKDLVGEDATKAEETADLVMGEVRTVLEEIVAASVEEVV